MIKQAVILCGGKGERLGDVLRYDPVTVYPKALIEVGGKPFITYLINTLKGIGFDDIILAPVLTKEQGDWFKPFTDALVRLVVSDATTANGGVLAITNLRETFLLLNGDSYPITDWRAFMDTDTPRVAVKIIGRDAGAAIVAKQDVESGDIDVLNIKGMMGLYENYIVLGGLHIGTPAGLQRARTFMDIVVYGQ